MSQRARDQHHRSNIGHAGQHHSHVHSHGHDHAHSHAHGRRGGYTINHAGKQVRLGPISFWIFVGSLVVMAGWSLATGPYFAFHDDVLTRLIARQAG